jgi:MATE family multidrug resistance protein
MSIKSILRRKWNEPGGYSEFLGLAIPMIMSTSMWSVQHFVNRMFLTWYSPEAIAAAMPAGLLNFAVASLFIGTASYTGTFVAQYQGAGMLKRVGPAIWQGVFFSIIGALISLVLIPLAGPIFKLAGHSPAVQELEVTYFKMLCFATFPMVASSAMSGFFSGLSRPWPVFFVDITVTAVNIVLDYCLIFGNWGFPEMGIKGAGIASVIAVMVAFFIYLGLMLRPGESKKYAIASGFRFDKELFKRLLKFGFPSGVQFFIDMAGFTAFVLLVGRLGTVSLAATNIAFNINTLAFMPMLGAGIAVSVLTGRYIGMNKPEIAVKSTFSGFHITMLYMGTIAFLLGFFPNIFVSVFSAKAHGNEMVEISILTAILLRFVAVYSLFDAVNIIFSSTLKGAGDTRYVMVSIVLCSLFILIMPTWLALKFGGGIYSCWIIASSYIIVLSFFFYLRFKNGAWKSMRVIEQHISVIPPSCAEVPDARPE